MTSLPSLKIISELSSSKSSSSSSRSRFIYRTFSLFCSYVPGGKIWPEESFPQTQLRELIFKFFAVLHASDTQMKLHSITFPSHTAAFSVAAQRWIFSTMHSWLEALGDLIKIWDLNLELNPEMPTLGWDRLCLSAARHVSASHGHVITLRSQWDVCTSVHFSLSPRGNDPRTPSTFICFYII